MAVLALPGDVSPSGLKAVVVTRSGRRLRFDPSAIRFDPGGQDPPWQARLERITSERHRLLCARSHALEPFFMEQGLRLPPLVSCASARRPPLFFVKKRVAPFWVGTSDRARQTVVVGAATRAVARLELLSPLGRLSLRRALGGTFLGVLPYTVRPDQVTLRVHFRDGRVRHYRRGRLAG